MTKGIGSLGFAAPELFDGEDVKYDNRVDVFSTGATMFKVANLKVAFPGGLYAILGMVGRKEKAKYAEFCPVDMREVIDQCMTFELEKRPSIESIIRTLQGKFASQLTKHE
jgi:serine/threonine protein kinase